MGPHSRVIAVVLLSAMTAACSSGGGVAIPSTAGGGGGAASATNPGGAASSTGGDASSSAFGPSTSGGGGSASDPCSLLTQAEVSTIVGQPVGPGDNTTDSHECDFQYPQNDVPKVQASITIESATSIDDLCTAGTGYTVTMLSGIGDGACFDSVAGLTSGDNLTFAHGGHVFTVAASFGSSAGEDKILAADKALALAALAHLP